MKFGKKLIREVPKFALLIGIVVTIGSAFSFSPISSSDWADDFGFGAHRSRVPSSVAGMSIEQIALILSDRMGSTSKDQTKKLSGHILKLCQRYRFDPAFILSVIQAESGFNSAALSPAGAVGLMQIMPGTAQVVLRDMKPPLDGQTLLYLAKQGQGRNILMDPFINLTLGVTYLASLRDRYRQLHPYYVLAAYNMGPAKMDELMSKKTFKPDKTKKYFEAIRQGTSQFRLYRANRRPADFPPA